MSQKKIIFIIAIILIAITAIAFLILKKYSTIFADTNAQWIYTQESGANVIKNKITNNTNLTNVKFLSSSLLADINAKPSGMNTNCGDQFAQKCALAKIAPTNFLYLGNNILFPELTLIVANIGLPSQKIVSSGIFWDTPANQSYMCVTITNKGNNNKLGYLCNLDAYKKVAPFSNDMQTRLKNLNNNQWWTQYYNYVLGLKNIIISMDETNIITNTTLPDSVKQACNDNLVQQPLDINNMPAEITNAFNAIRTKFDQPNFDPTSVFGGQQGLKDYLISLHGTFQVNRDQPWLNYNTVKSRLSNDESVLSSDIDNIWTQANAIQDTKTSAMGCTAGAVFAGAAAVAGGTGFTGFKIASTATELGCTALAGALNAKISNNTKQKFLTDVTKTVYDSYYSTKYLAYLNCIANNADTPQEIKDIINKQLNDIQSQLLTLQGLQKEGSDAASQSTSFWDTIFGGFTDMMKQAMTTILNFLWKSLFSGSPL